MLMRNEPDIWQVKSALPVLRRLIHSTDEEVVADACWALSYLSDVPINNIQDIIEAGVCPKLVELLLYVALPFTAYFILSLHCVFHFPLHHFLFQLLNNVG